MTEPPARTKPREAWTVADIVAHGRTGEEPISDEWRSYVADVAKAAGVEPQDLGLRAAEKDPAAMTVQDHVDRIRRYRD